jgi:carboxymethylenebutenolidase
MNEMVSILGREGDGAVEAYVSLPDPSGRFPALIVIEEIWGLTDHIKDVCDRFAKEGFVVISPELIDNETLAKMRPELFAQMRSDDEAVKHEAQAKMREATAPIHTKAFADASVKKLKTCVDYALAHRCANGAIGVVGFCFGGTYAFQLAMHDARIKAAVPFYGSAPDPLETVVSIKAPILAFYGEDDTRLVAGLPRLVEAMDREERDFSYMLYPHTGHAFFNDTNKLAYNEDAARDAWEKSLAFLHKHLDVAD